MVSSQVLDRIALLVETQNRIAAELARAVRHGELTQAPEHDGLKTMGPWLRGHCRLSPTAAAQVVRNGRALEHLPAVAAGCADGQITADQVGIIAEITRPERLAQAAEQQVDLAAVDEALAAVAATRSHADLARVVHHYLERLDQDGAEPDRPSIARCASPSTPTAASAPGSNSMRSGARSSRLPWSRWCKRTAPPAISAAAPSSSAMRWCSCATTPSRREACRCSARTSPTCSSPCAWR